jgi:hypothetical protein
MNRAREDLNFGPNQSQDNDAVQEYSQQDATQYLQTRRGFFGNAARKLAAGAIVAGSAFATPKEASAYPVYGYDDDHGHNPLQQKVQREMQPQLNKLMQLQYEKPEAVFGNSVKAATYSPEALKQGKVHILIGCMDERVPDPEDGVKIGVAGAGILMTHIPKRENVTKWTEDQIYAYLADPLSGDDNFKKFVAGVDPLHKTNAQIECCDHELCGAAGLFAKQFEEETGKKIDPKKAGAAAALRLHRALKLKGKPKTAGFKAGEVRMNGSDKIHDAVGMAVLGHDRLTLSKVKVDEKPLRVLLVNGLHAPSIEYLQTEVRVGSQDIIGSSHGIGNKHTPILLFGGTESDERSADDLKKSLGDLPNRMGTPVFKVS